MNNNGRPNAWVADNGDGTFTNPIMWGDYPDNDVIRVDDTYYMLSTSMQLIPGCPIVKSKDLVNWEFCSYAVEKVDIPQFEFINGDQYAEGPWASSLTYHNGTFYVLFNMNRLGSFVCTTTNIEGPWEMTFLGEGQELYDPGMFFDDDGRVYVVHGKNPTYISEMSDDALSIKSYKIKTLFTEKNGAEGSRVYKINGYYYVLQTPIWLEGHIVGKKQIAYRAKNILGPYEGPEDILTSFSNWCAPWAIHQGAIVDTPTGEWWSIIFQDRYPYGRVPTLQPVTWINDWPYLGLNKGTKGVVTHKKPNVGGGSFPITAPATDDEFDGTTLGLQWQWNHYPDNSKWSLTERPGFMRLKTASVTDNFIYARNTLSQRVLGPDSSAIIKMDITNMVDGDVAGLALFVKMNNFIAVRKNNGVKTIVLNDNGCLEISSVKIDSDTVWLKADCTKVSATVNYYFSTDGIKFIHLGDAMPLRQSGYVGIRYGIFNFATVALGGFVDVDWYRQTTSETHGNLFSLGKMIDGDRYDDASIGDTDWAQDVIFGCDQMSTNNIDGSWLQFNQVDFGAGADKFHARVAVGGFGCHIEIRQDSLDGKLLGNCAVTTTVGWQNWTTVSCDLTGAKGKQKIFLLFKGSKAKNLVNLGWFKFDVNKTIPDVPTGVVATGNTNSKISITCVETIGAKKYDIIVDGSDVISDVTLPYTIKGFEANTIHSFKVRSKNDAGTSEWTEEIYAVTMPYALDN